MSAAEEQQTQDIRTRISNDIKAEWNDECCGHQNPAVCPACRVYERVLYLIDGPSDAAGEATSVDRSDHPPYTKEDADAGDG